jgi:hypothetical protein
MLSINDVTKIDDKRKQMRKEIYIKIYEQLNNLSNLVINRFFSLFQHFYLVIPYLTEDSQLNMYQDNLN